MFLRPWSVVSKPQGSSVFISCLDGLLHPGALTSQRRLIRQRAWTVSCLAAGLVVLAAFPFLILDLQNVAPQTWVWLGWLISHLGLLVLLSRTGSEAITQVASTGLLALTVCVGSLVAGLSPVVAAFLLALGIVEPLMRRWSWVIPSCLAVTATGIGGVLALPMVSGTFPPPESASAGALVAELMLFSQAVLVGLRVFMAQRQIESELDRVQSVQAVQMSRTREACCYFSQDGDIRYTCASFAKVLKWQQGAVTTRGLFNRLLPQDRPAFLKAQGENTATGRPQSVQIRLVDGDDKARLYHVEFHKMGCEIPDCADAAQLAFFRDLSEFSDRLSDLEEELDRTRAALSSRNYNIALACHEIKTPLNAIVGFSELLLNANNYSISPETRHEYLELIAATGRHMAKVTESTLELAALDADATSFEVSDFDIQSCLDECLALVRQSAEQERIDLRLQLDEAIGSLAADQTAVRQIFTNLLTNAVKFTDQGGTVTVSATRTPDDVCIEVADTGIGIDAADLPHVCEPFVQARSAKLVSNKGNGLGLALAKKLTERQGGQLQITSRIGQGTSVVVRLPANASGSSHRSHEPQSLPERCVA